MSVESLDEIVVTTPEDERGAHRSDVGSVVDAMTFFERRGGGKPAEVGVGRNTAGR